MHTAPNPTGIQVPKESGKTGPQQLAYLCIFPMKPKLCCNIGHLPKRGSNPLCIHVKMWLNTPETGPPYLITFGPA